LAYMVHFCVVNGAVDVYIGCTYMHAKVMYTSKCVVGNKRQTLHCVLQCVAVCCSVLQCVAVLAHTTQYAAPHTLVLACKLHFCITGRLRPIGSLPSYVIFCKRATNHRALLREMTYKDKASYESSYAQSGEDP